MVSRRDVGATQCYVFLFKYSNTRDYEEVKPFGKNDTWYKLLYYKLLVVVAVVSPFHNWQKHKLIDTVVF